MKQEQNERLVVGSRLVSHFARFIASIVLVFIKARSLRSLTPIKNPPPMALKNVCNPDNANLCDVMPTQPSSPFKSAKTVNNPHIVVPVKHPRYVVQSILAVSLLVTDLFVIAAPARARFPVNAEAPVSVTAIMDRGNPIAPNKKFSTPEGCQASWRAIIVLPSVEVHRIPPSPTKIPARSDFFNKVVKGCLHRCAPSLARRAERSRGGTTFSVD